MAVTMGDPTPKKEELPQSIALELAKCGRYIRVGDNTVYEKGVVYDVAEAYATELLSLTDDFGYPIFMREKVRKEREARKAAEVEAAKEVRTEVRAPVKKPAGPKPAVTARKIEIADEDDELAARLAKLDEPETPSVKV